MPVLREAPVPRAYAPQRLPQNESDALSSPHPRPTPVALGPVPPLSGRSSGWTGFAPLFSVLYRFGTWRVPPVECRPLAAWESSKVWKPWPSPRTLARALPHLPWRKGLHERRRRVARRGPRETKGLVPLRRPLLEMEPT